MRCRIDSCQEGRETVADERNTFCSAFLDDHADGIDQIVIHIGVRACSPGDDKACADGGSTGVGDLLMNRSSH